MKQLSSYKFVFCCCVYLLGFGIPPSLSQSRKQYSGVSLFVFRAPLRWGRLSVEARVVCFRGHVSFLALLRHTPQGWRRARLIGRRSSLYKRLTGENRRKNI